MYAVLVYADFYRLYAETDHLSKMGGKGASYFLYCNYSEIGGDMMQVEIKIDANCDETKVTITTGKMTDEISELARKISEHTPSVLVGFRDESASILDCRKIIRFYSANQKVYAVTEEAEYTIRLRLYELEGRLGAAEFVRISNAEIINLKEVKGFDLSFTGTICVQFRDDSVSYVSRRYVTKIKQILGM